MKLVCGFANVIVVSYFFPFMAILCSTDIIGSVCSVSIVVVISNKL